MLAIDTLIGKMTLAEKLGQLTMTASSYAVTGPVIAGDSTQAIKDGTIGNLLNMVGADHVRETKRDDPPECVIDELAGQWLACAFCLLSFGGLLPAPHISLPMFFLAFALFRLFDIWKPWPVSWADQNIKGGLGVMTDDMIAGLMAGVLIVAARYFFHL